MKLSNQLFVIVSVALIGFAAIFVLFFYVVACGFVWLIRQILQHLDREIEYSVKLAHQIGEGNLSSSIEGRHSEEQTTTVDELDHLSCSLTEGIKYYSVG